MLPLRMLFDGTLDGQLPVGRFHRVRRMEYELFVHTFDHVAQNELQLAAPLDLGVARHVNRIGGGRLRLERRHAVPAGNLEGLQARIAAEQLVGVRMQQLDVAGAVGAVQAVRLDGQATAKVPEQW